MAFTRKSKNRRFERTHVLDVKLSALQRRRLMARILALALLVCFMLAVGVFVVMRGGDWLLRRLVYENPAFAIHQLDLQTDGVLSLEQLRAWAGVKLRDNVMAVDISRIKRDLEMVPIIESAAVERVLPHTLRIRICEREPIALVPLPPFRPGATNPPRAFFTLDAKGYFMFTVDAQQRSTPAPTNERMPVIVGIPPSDMRPGRPSESSQVHAALRLVQAFEQSPLKSRLDLIQIDVASPKVLLATSSQTNEIVFGLGDMDLQVRRWHAVMEQGQRLGRQLAWMDLSVANNVPVRWQETSLTGPVNSRTNQTTFNRKKHV